MATARTSITLDEALLLEARREAGPGGVSGLVADALRRELSRRRQVAALDELIALGSPTLADLAEARAVLASVVDFSDTQLRELIPDSLAIESGRAKGRKARQQ